ncbi:CYTH domain-containing protein [Billgrantia gudaonensis]|uniref:CYTH domain-containing protein n=1 Tax=Billgrantia gudaonensis TaxID=376427 RepID=A0A1G8RHF9_9GAMM|nr:CYTH domain-containing protein [Halomonas gudaonensis]SDJ15800.1 CYTH domain-containing protein [Halomonas gudaonensis]
MGQEIELKLALGPTGPQALTAHPRLAGLSPTTLSLANTYYDTPDGALQAARMALRLRRRGDALRQTLKTEGSGAGGLSRRGEWEWPVPGPGLDLPGLAELPPMAALGQDALERLAPRFTTDFTRHVWTLTLADARVEIALDEGEIRSGNRRAPIRELELELETGTPESLWQLAAELAERVALRPSETSKAARGTALLAAEWKLPPGGPPLAGLKRAMSALDALADTGDERWRQVARESLGTLEDRDADDLAARLSAADWLTPAFGQVALHLARRLNATASDDPEPTP